MRKITCLLVAAAAIALSACSQAPKEASASRAETEAKESKAEDTKAEEKAEEKKDGKKIKIGVTNCADTDTLTKMVADYLEV